MQARISVSGDGAAKLTLRNGEDIVHESVMQSGDEELVFDFTEPVVLTVERVENGDPTV